MAGWWLQLSLVALVVEGWLVAGGFGCRWWLVALLLLTLLVAGCNDAKTMPERCQKRCHKRCQKRCHDAKTMPERCQKKMA
eukprot:scaffold99386_cov30-Cyclotella_meneghiniana.AAC.3